MLPPLIPREVLFGNPSQVRPVLSPDGAMLGYIAPLDGVLNVWVREVRNGTVVGAPVAVTHDTVRGIRFFTWAEDGEHLLYIQDKAGDENWHVYAVRVSDQETRDLTPYENVQAQIVGVERDVPDRILLAINVNNAALHDVYDVRIADGESKIVAENPGDVAGWVADAQLNVRACVAQTPEGGWDIRARQAPDGAWESVHTTGPEDEASPAIFTEDGRGLYLITSKGLNTKQIGLLDLPTKDFRIVAGRDDVDLGGTLFHPTTRVLQAVAFERHRQEWVILDEAVRPDFTALEPLQKRGDIGIDARTNADDFWVVSLSRDTGSAEYYLYRRADRSHELLFAARPELSNYTLAPMQAVDITARDGLVLPSYLTVPVGTEPKKLPLVLNVHGGPWARDAWGYHPEAQWFANRGYACLQVNFRASEGFGKAFVHAGDREWGGKMLDDLVDAVRWAIDQGIADPERIAIYGGSYGGYAVLSALAFRPEVFTCGVDIVGPSSIITLLNSIPPYWEPVRKMFENRVGSVANDEEFLKERSPLFSVDRIVKPLLIAQGANDPRVKQAESEQMVKALKDAGKTVEYMLFEDEGHGFARPENRLTFYAAAESFLARYLGGRTEPSEA